jgi:hypothetical protein
VTIGACRSGETPPGSSEARRERGSFMRLLTGWRNLSRLARMILTAFGAGEAMFARASRGIRE